MRHDDMRGIPRTILEPALLEERSILPGNRPFEETYPARASEGPISQEVVPYVVRDSRLDTEECSCLAFCARVLIWASRNSRAE